MATTAKQRFEETVNGARKSVEVVAADIERKEKVMNDENQSAVRGTLRVYVGFAWQKNCDCRSDARWSAIKKYFKKTNEYIEKKYGVRVDFGRLRASHGRFVWDSVRHKIGKADILLFDVAAMPAKDPRVGENVRYQGFNTNVVLELGAALMNPNAKIIVMCPTNIKNRWPSDLSGLMYTEYQDEQTRDGFKRKFLDKWGVLPQYRARLAEVVEEKGWCSNADEEEEIPQEEIEQEEKGQEMRCEMR